MSQRPASFPLRGGMDLITPAVEKAPGSVIASLNYEPVAGGYRRFQGYERFDGRSAPSAASYWRINYTDGGFGSGTAPAVGALLYNGASDHFIVVAVVITSGTFAGANAAGYFIGTDYQGTISPTEALFSAASAGFVYATAGTITHNYDFGATLNATYLAGAITQTRNKILAVTGSGAIRGIWGFNGNIYAFRDNAGVTAGVMFKATTAGWVAATNFVRVDFTSDTGAGQVVALTKNHENVSNASGGASKGHIETVVITGTVGAVYTGYLLLSGYVAASFTAGGQIIYKAGTATQFGTTTAAATLTATVPAGGRYFFLNHNFYGAQDRDVMYIVNGVGKALAYNGTGYAEIGTGMATDTPNRLAVHRQALFLGFPGGSLQFSRVGEPLVFDPVLGAGELDVGSDITDLIPQSNSTLAIFAQSSISILYGNDPSDYQLATLTEADGDEAVALPYTAQRLGNVLYMDNVGIRSMATTTSFGNFALGTISRLIEPLLRDFRIDGVNPVATLTWKRKDQYWVFFDNGTAIVAYMGSKHPQVLPLNLGFTVTCATTITVNGIERAFVGTSTGYVMELDKGTSFDGAVIEHYVRLPFYGFGQSQVEKRAHKVIFDIEASGNVTLGVSVELDFGSVEGIPVQTVTITPGGGAIDNLGSNEAYYDAQVETQGEIYVDAVARDFSLKIGGSTSTELPHKLTGVTYLITPLELVR